MELAGDLDWEPGAGLVYLRRLTATAVSWRAVNLPSAGPRQGDRRRVTLRESARYRP